MPGTVSPDRYNGQPVSPDRHNGQAVSTDRYNGHWVNKYGQQQTISAVGARKRSVYRFREAPLKLTNRRAQYKMLELKKNKNASASKSYSVKTPGPGAWGGRKLEPCVFCVSCTPDTKSFVCFG